jgi:DNA-binding NtrC family response regulator
MTSATKTVLIVDDEATQRRLIENMVQREGYETLVADSGEAAIEMVVGGATKRIDAIILDLAMPKLNGIDVIKRIRPVRPDLPIIVLTAYSSISNSVESMRAGANDFLLKPASADRIRQALANALGREKAEGELRPLTEKLGKQLTFDQLVGSATGFQAALDVARKAAASNAPVLIEGESGVGKELIAQSIASASKRAGKPFIVVNCGALPANLVESILFGHEKGAFTGAVDKHVGKFQEASGGTIFLDEIGELPLEAQVKLLRVLQEQEVEPVGGRKPEKVDVRVISATNRDLVEEVGESRFREDLFYRLNVVTIHIPPLRERREDIAALAKHFLERFASTESVLARRFAQDAIDTLTAFTWPGNVRQLQNAILCDSETLTSFDFPQLASQRSMGLSSPGIVRSAENGRGHADGWANGSQRQDEGLLRVLDETGHLRPMLDIEAELIRLALARYRGRMTEIARRLGIGRSTLYRKIAELGLDQTDSRQSY